jgi:DNA modification methylase
MIVLVWAVTIVLTAYAAFQIGRRWEIGEREEELEALEREREVRGRRSGSIKLSTMKIRR